MCDKLKQFFTLELNVIIILIKLSDQNALFKQK